MDILQMKKNVQFVKRRIPSNGTIKTQVQTQPDSLYSLLQIRPRIRIKKFLENPALLVLQFPIQLKQMTDEETREYHLKKLFELSLKSLGQIPQGWNILHTSRKNG